MNFLFPALGILAFLTLLSIFIKEKSETLKYLLFGGIVLIVLSYTVYLVGSTISININSVTKGPVHYHADFEIWNCGQKVDLVDPKGLSNKIGTPILHEHNDNRIHVEGPVQNLQNISLGKFFEVIGGKLGRNSLMVPTGSGMVKAESGMDCNGELAQMQVFVYQTKDHTFNQQKLDDPSTYVLSSYSQVPPGDCIIIEFEPKKDRTDKLCNFYKVAKEKGELRER